MRVVLQRVARAEVRVAGRVTGKIGAGFLVLAGFAPSDGDANITWMADKVLGLRVFGDAAGKMNLALAEVGGALLVVSQFTLYGECRAARGGDSPLRTVCGSLERAGSRERYGRRNG